MNYKFIQNISLEKNIGTIAIYDEITLNSGNYISDELRYLSSQVSTINVRLNSIGGNVIAAFGIFSTIRDLISKGYEVNTFNDGIAFSSAGWILQAGKKRYAADFSLFMMHDPYNASGTDNEVTQMFRDSIVQILSTNSNLSSEEVSSMMANDGGEGTFLDATDQLNNGFVDEVFSTELNREVTDLLNKSKSIEEVLSISNSLYSNKNKKDMSELNSLLGLKNEASLAAQKSAIQELVNKAAKTEELQAQLATTISKVEDLENKLEEEQNARAEVLVENAFKAGKFQEEQKEVWLNMAKKDFENAKILLDGITATKNTFVDATQIPDGKQGKDTTSGTPSEMTEAREYYDLFKNDGGALLDMQKNDNEKYLRLRNSYTNQVNKGTKF